MDDLHSQYQLVERIIGKEIHDHSFCLFKNLHTVWFLHQLHINTCISITFARPFKSEVSSRLPRLLMQMARASIFRVQLGRWGTYC